MDEKNRKDRLGMVFALVALAAVWVLTAGCASIRPYRMGGPEIEDRPMAAPQRNAPRARLPQARPLVVSLFGWHVANPVGMVLNYDGNRRSVSPLAGTYYARSVHVALFEAVFDEINRRRRWVFRDYIGHAQPGLIPAWARRQRFLIMEGEIVRFEHTKISPSKKPSPRGGNPSPTWGHEGGSVQLRVRLRDSVTMRIVFDKMITTYCKSVHTNRALSFNVYRALTYYLVELLRREPAFMGALGGR
jgi:hypothetical protein